MFEDSRDCMEIDQEEWNHFDIDMEMRYRFWESLYGRWEDMK